MSSHEKIIYFLSAIISECFKNEIIILIYNSLQIRMGHRTLLKNQKFSNMDYETRVSSNINFLEIKTKICSLRMT